MQPTQDPQQPPQPPQQPLQPPQQPLQQPLQPLQQPLQEPLQPLQQPMQPLQQPLQLPTEQPQQPPQQPQQPAITPASPAPAETFYSGSTNTGSGASAFDLFNSMLQAGQSPPPPQPLPQPQPTQPAAPITTTTAPPPPSMMGGPGPSSAGPSFMDLYASMLRASSPGSFPTASSFGSGFTGSNAVAPAPTPAPTTTASPNSLMDYYERLRQAVNPYASQPQPQPQPQPTAPAPVPTPRYATNPFAATSTSHAPASTTTAAHSPSPRLVPFVPPEWNLAAPSHGSQPAGASPLPWGSSTSHGTTGWGHNTQHHGPTAWEQYYHHNHRPAPPTTTRGPPPHPMSKMLMVPRIRDMIKKQATQFGDMAYYKQHGCVDPTPPAAGTGGVRPTQTLVYGCTSPVSKMVCMRAGRKASPQGSSMAMMMAMLNPGMARTFEKCLTPKILTQMMFQGISGGAGGMNPMMMMAMGTGGGGAGVSMMPIIMMMLNQKRQQQQQQLQQQQQQGGAGMGGGFFGGMGTGTGGGSMAGTGSAGGLGGGLSGVSGGLGGSGAGGAGPWSQSSTSVPLPQAGSAGKTVYQDPSAANTLISQAARIPAGAAQPTSQAPANPFMTILSNMMGLSSFGGGNMLGGGGGQSQATQTHLPNGAASGGQGQQQQEKVDCSMLIPLIMSKVMVAGEGMTSPEAMEAIGEMRRQYLPFTCQELRIKYTGMPFRLCCPGKVEQPSVFELFRAKNTVAA